MKLLIKQRVFSLTDSYDVYDENENPKYYVKGEMFSWGHRLHIYVKETEKEVGFINQKLLSLMPVFEIELQGQKMGSVRKKFNILHNNYVIDYNGWQVDGDFMGWNYKVHENESLVLQITKEPLHWGDTYILDYDNLENELQGLLLVIAIDAANSYNYGGSVLS